MLKLAVLSVVLAVVTCQDVVHRDAPATRYIPPRAHYDAPRYNRRVEDRINYIDETPKPYAFSYAAPVDQGVGSSSRTESADANGRVVGSYTLVNEEGHSRYVDYTADENGFRATIRTDEPGTANQSPADVILESSAPHPYAANVDRAYYRPVNVVRTNRVRTPAAAAAVSVVEDVDHQPLVEAPVVAHRGVPSYNRRVVYRSPYY